MGKRHRVDRIWKADGMVLEVADIRVHEGSEADFAAGFLIAREVIVAAPGCHSAQMGQSIETPSRFVLRVEWDSVEAHQHFRDSAQFADWRAPIGKFFAGPPYVEHVVDL
jgi:quinol monooxygenase YgiN